MNNLSTAPRARLHTTFGTVVFVDAASGEVRHGAIDDTRANAVLVADQSLIEGPRTAWLMYDAFGVLEPIMLSADGCWRASSTKMSGASVKPRSLRMVRLDRGLIAVCTENPVRI